MPDEPLEEVGRPGHHGDRGAQLSEPMQRDPES